jgi:Flp pilus assembly pilin Flp
MNHDPRHGEAGQTMAEYAVVLGSVCAAVVLALTLFGNAIQAGIERAASMIPH